MKKKCLECVLYKMHTTRFIKHLVETGILSINEDRIKGVKTPDAEPGTRTLSDLQKARMNAPDAREEPPAGDEPIPDGDPAPAPKTTPPGAITYRHKCTREGCNSVRVNRLPDGVNCPKCGSLMISAQVNPHGSYKKRKGSISKKAAPARNQGKKQAPRGLDALFEQHPAPGIVSG